MNLRPASLPPLISKSDQAALPALEIFLRPALGFAFLMRGVDHIHNLGLLGEPGRDGGRIGRVALDAQRQRLDALEREKGVERRHAGAEIAQKFRPGLEDVGNRPEGLRRFAPHRAVIAGIGRIERGLALFMLLPREVTAVDEEAADRGAVSA